MLPSSATDVGTVQTTQTKSDAVSIALAFHKTACIDKRFKSWFIGTISGSCDFEIDYCGMTHPPSNDKNFTRHYGTTLSTGSGPSHDATLNETGACRCLFSCSKTLCHAHNSFAGYYLYLEASGLAAGAVAAIETIDLFPTTVARNDCYVTWWAHQYGQHIGQLSVSQRYTDARKASVLLATISGDKGDRWHFYSAGPLDMQSGNYKIIFVATRGNGFQGDISLDKITFTPGCHDGKTSWNAICLI